LRYFIEFAYKGTNYHGWQSQPNAVTVQETLDKALSVVLNCAIETLGAGRTDTGVHASQMYAHFDCQQQLESDTIVYKLNSFLPNDIAVYHIISVNDHAHARFDAKKRTYEYHIYSAKNPFTNETSWYHHNELDVDLMNQAAKMLIGKRDFQCFSKVNTEVNNFICQIFEAHWHKENDELIFTISADRFLRNMVRAIVGTLVNIGLGKSTVAALNTIIESKDRGKAGFSVPAHGLFLTKIEYDYIIPKGESANFASRSDNAENANSSMSEQEIL